MRQRRFGIGKVSGLKEKHQVWQGIKNFLFVTDSDDAEDLEVWNFYFFKSDWHVYVLDAAYFAWPWKSRVPW
jgi:hypothetical protein